VGASTVPTVTPAKLDTKDAIMATTNITDLPSSRALDDKAMSAIRGAAGAGDWCLYAFTPYQSAPPSPMVSNGTNYFSDQMNLNTTQDGLSFIRTGPA
jgi:hypothetical protein